MSWCGSPYHPNLEDGWVSHYSATVVPVLEREAALYKVIRCTWDVCGGSQLPLGLVDLPSLFLPDSPDTVHTSRAAGIFWYAVLRALPYCVRGVGLVAPYPIRSCGARQLDFLAEKAEGGRPDIMVDVDVDVDIDIDHVRGRGGVSVPAPPNRHSGLVAFVQVDGVWNGVPRAPMTYMLFHCSSLW